MGVVIDRTPKCHSKLAGEGIEYYWIFSKNVYCQFTTREKQGKDTVGEWPRRGQMILETSPKTSSVVGNSQRKRR